MPIEEILTYICIALGGSLITAIGLYITTSFKKSAEIDTISTNIEEIKAQQVTLTTATENVKEDIKHQVWKKQEYNQIIREKIEEYYKCIDEMPYYLIERYRCLFSNNEETPVDPFIRASLISHLYLPETYSKHKELADIYGDYHNLIITICDKQISSGTSFLDNLDNVKEIRDKMFPVILELKIIAQSKIGSIIQVD